MRSAKVWSAAGKARKGISEGESGKPGRPKGSAKLEAPEEKPKGRSEGRRKAKLDRKRCDTLEAQKQRNTAKTKKRNARRDR
jgi:hypothetical protein